MENPFKPTFGAPPPLLVGRDGLLAEFGDALDDGPGAAGRATIYTGARGSGKTVMLGAAEESARERGWITVSETATPGFISRLSKSRLPKVLRELDPDSVRNRLKGISLPVVGGGASWETIERHLAEIDFREQVELITDLLAENRVGLMITLDEIHSHQVEEMRELATTVQHAFREERELAFAGAGLASSVSDVLNDDVLTFLRRADRHHLGAVSLDDVGEALAKPIQSAGREVDADALDRMVHGTEGYPFLIQLVGSHCWKASTGSRITLADATDGVSRARRRLGALVHAPALNKASDIDKSFLVAMASDEDRSRMADIAERMGVGKEYAGMYRQRLIDAELIERAGHGYVAFALPYLRDYLREHVASDV